jgi:hypothetical protein
VPVLVHVLPYCYSILCPYPRSASDAARSGGEVNPIVELIGAANAASMEGDSRPDLDDVEEQFHEVGIFIDDFPEDAREWVKIVGSIVDECCNSATPSVPFASTSTTGAETSNSECLERVRTSYCNACEYRVRG